MQDKKYVRLKQENMLQVQLMVFMLGSLVSMIVFCEFESSERWNNRHYRSK